jgi:predicted nucleic acid-binding protein
MNPVVMAGNPYTLEDAWQAYMIFLASPEVFFAGEPAACDPVLGALVPDMSLSPNAWTDAFLAAFAIAGAMRFVTFDSDFNRFPGLDLLHLRT